MSATLLIALAAGIPLAGLCWVAAAVVERLGAGVRLRLAAWTAALALPIALVPVALTVEVMEIRSPLAATSQTCPRHSRRRQSRDANRHTSRSRANADDTCSRRTQTRTPKTAPCSGAKTQPAGDRSGRSAKTRHRGGLAWGHGGSRGSGPTFPR